MLPFVILIILASVASIKPGLLFLTGSLLLTWNFLFAIYPQYKYDYNSIEQYSAIISRHPETLFILTNKGEIETWFYYEKKIRPQNLYDPPSYLLSREKELQGLN